MESLNEEEARKVGLVRAFLERQYPSSKDVDDFELRRFLRATDMNVEKASAKFIKYLKWRQSFVPNGTISDSEVAKHISDNKFFSQGVDRSGRPILLALSARHVPVKGGADDMQRFYVYAFDKLCARMPPGQEKFVLISDLNGWGYANIDTHGSQGCFKLLQEYYPGRLGKVIILNAPRMFMSLWKILSTVLDNDTSNKVQFVAKKKWKETLLEDIDQSQLPDIYGGELPLVPIQNI